MAKNPKAINQRSDFILPFHLAGRSILNETKRPYLCLEIVREPARYGRV